jgi:hypothetical protein
MKRSAQLLMVLAAALMLTTLPVLAQTPPVGLPEMQTAAPSGTIVIKLTAQSELAMAPEGLVSRPGALSRAAAKAAGLQELAAELVPGARLTQRIPTARVVPADKARHSGQPDLALYADLVTQGLDRQELIRIMARLNAHPDVELAFLEPRAVPAALGFDAWTGRYTPPAVAPTAQRTVENFQDQQGYLEQAPLGVGALAMRETPGQRGAGVTVIDVEGGWLWTHEDLPAPVVELGVQIDELSWRNHGTAVMGEMRGIDNGTGVTGIVPDCQVGSSSIGNVSTAAALHAAIEFLQPGDVILIELHAPGPLADGSGQFGYLPMEYWQDNFDAIRLATSRGILVCEAAGNGNQDLDNPVYMNLFDRQVRDSGAIMCGATAGSDLISAGFSNHGQRVDLNGWGWDVTTTGYGDLYGAEEFEFYTYSFSGTSSASPIVTGSVASLQGMVRQELGIDLDARLARDLLRTTGTPMGAGNLIGTRPNLEAAFALASTSVGELRGTVTDQATGTPLAGVLIQVEEQGSFTSTGDDGTWRLPLQEGPVDLTFTSFLFQDTTISSATTAGVISVVDQALTMRPLIDLRGTVFGPDQTPLEAVRVTPLNHPVSGGTSGPGGSFTVTDVPAGYTYRLLFDGLPGYGAQVVVLETSVTSGDVLVNPQLVAVTEDFESGPGGFTSTDGLWQHGQPPLAVTGGAFDGNSCWGIGMTAPYLDDESDVLLSPIYDLTGETATSFVLSFHYFGATEGGFDGVNLEASQGDGFTVLEPLDSYTDLTLSGIGGMPGWSGETAGWRGVVFDISAFVGGTFQFRLNWGSDAGVTADGFFIDGLAMGPGPRVTPVPDSPVPQIPDSPRITAWPNPFNPRVNLAYELPAAGMLEVAIYDVRGRMVKHLQALTPSSSQGTLSWDGRNDQGRPVPSGVYFVRWQGDSWAPAVSRVVLAK